MVSVVGEKVTLMASLGVSEGRAKATVTESPVCVHEYGGGFGGPGGGLAVCALSSDSLARGIGAISSDEGS